MSFVLAGLIFVLGILAAVVVAFAQGMATAPQYDNSPLYIFVGAAVLAVFVGSSHWIGW